VCVNSGLGEPDRLTHNSYDHAHNSSYTLTQNRAFSISLIESEGTEKRISFRLLSFARTRPSPKASARQRWRGEPSEALAPVLRGSLLRRMERRAKGYGEFCHPLFHLFIQKSGCAVSSVSSLRWRVSFIAQRTNRSGEYSMTLIHPVSCLISQKCALLRPKSAHKRTLFITR
jgi:hypothetical protein